jgi:hypothetical protein
MQNCGKSTGAENGRVTRAVAAGELEIVLTLGRMRFPTSRPPPKYEDHAYHTRAKAYARAEELNDVHSAIYLEARALRHPEKSDEANQQRDNPNRMLQVKVRPNKRR